MARTFREQSFLGRNFRTRHSHTLSYKARDWSSYSFKALCCPSLTFKVQYSTARTFRVRRSTSPNFKARHSETRRATLASAQLQGATLDLAWLQGAVLSGAHLQGASLELAKLSGASLQAQLQGASLGRATLIATDLSAAFLWRADFGAAALVDLRLPPATDQWLPVWMKSGNTVEPWKDNGYQDLRERMELIPAGPLRDQALDRIRRLDCANTDPTLASCSPSADDTSQQKSLENARVDDSTYAKYLAAVLKDLVCNGVDNGGFFFSGRMPMSRDSANVRSRASGATIFPDWGGWP
jgi:Pentapeptide repeats (8 copies)